MNKIFTFFASIFAFLFERKDQKPTMVSFPRSTIAIVGKDKVIETVWLKRQSSSNQRSPPSNDGMPLADNRENLKARDSPSS